MLNIKNTLNHFVNLIFRPHQIDVLFYGIFSEKNGDIGRPFFNFFMSVHGHHAKQMGGRQYFPFFFYRIKIQ